MARDSTKGAGDWRGTRSRRAAPGPKRTAATKWLQAAVVSALMLGVAGVAVWLLMPFALPTNPRAYFVPFWFSTYQDRLGIPTVPWTRADRDAILGEKGALFSKIDEKEAPDQPLETVKERLDGLLERAGDDADARRREGITGGRASGGGRGRGSRGRLRQRSGGPDNQVGCPLGGRRGRQHARGQRRERQRTRGDGERAEHTAAAGRRGCPGALHGGVAHDPHGDKLSHADGNPPGRSPG